MMTAFLRMFLMITAYGVCNEILCPLYSQGSIPCTIDVLKIPPFFTLVLPRSILVILAVLLSFFAWSQRSESNRRPTDYESLSENRADKQEVEGVGYWSSPRTPPLLPYCYPGDFCNFWSFAKWLILLVRPARLELATF
jgi:hypothetical protein